MTALDRAFIKAYVPHTATADEPVKPSADAYKVSAVATAEEELTPAMAAPAAVAEPPLAPLAAAPATPATPHHGDVSRNDVLAALAQPCRKRLDTAIGHAPLATSPIGDRSAGACGIDLSLPHQDAPLCTSAPSPTTFPAIEAPAAAECAVAVAEAPAASNSASLALNFAAFRRPLTGSDAPSSPPLSAFLQLHDTAAAAEGASEDSPAAAVPPMKQAEPSPLDHATEELAGPADVAEDHISEPAPAEPLAAEAPLDSAPATATVANEPADELTPPVGSSLRPVWQVEQFTWPKTCRRLIARAADALDHLADALISASQHGQKVLALGGWQRGEGATTMLLCAARRLAERGLKCALVDADLERPRLAKRLGIQPQAGWNDPALAAAGTPLDHVVVEATVNNLALVPACEPPEEGTPATTDCTGLADCLETLRQNYDLVLLDLGPLEAVRARMDHALGQAFANIDAVVLVRDRRLTPEDAIPQVENDWAATGIAIAGVIENFVEA